MSEMKNKISEIKTTLEVSTVGQMKQKIESVI